MIVNGINMNGWGVGVEGLGGAAPGWNFEFANVSGWATPQNPENYHFFSATTTEIS
jgi:hypothetical protein